MNEIVGDIFSQPRDPKTTAICFTSNGILKSDRSLVMGAGIAKAFRDRYSKLAFLIGGMVKRNGNHVYMVKCSACGLVDNVCSFPTKNHWRDQSDLGLIEQSAKELVELANLYGWTRIYLPRPGCALGGLDWENQVKPLIAPIFDDRFYIITLK